MALYAPRPATSAVACARVTAARARRIRTAREDRLLGVDGDVCASGNDEDRYAERGKRSEQAMLPKPAMWARCPVPRPSRRRAEALPRQAPATRDPVQDRLKSSRSPQPQVKPCGLSPGHCDRAGSAEPGLDALQAIGSRLEGIGSRVQGPAQGRLALAQRAHRSRSSTVRNACMARAV